MIRAIHVKPSLMISCTAGDDCNAPACQVLMEVTDCVLDEVIQAECPAHMTPGCNDCGEISCDCAERDDSHADFKYLHPIS